MKGRFVVAGVDFAVAMPASSGGSGEIAPPNFEHGIPYIPGRPLIAMTVEYPPVAASPSHVLAVFAVDINDNALTIPVKYHQCMTSLRREINE